MLSDHLGKNGVTARAHIGSTNKHHERTVIVQLDGNRTDIDAGNARTLHGHAYTSSAHFAITHFTYWVLCFPIKQFSATLHAAIERAGISNLAIVSRHGHALTHHVLLANGDRIYAQLFSKFVHRGFNSELTLRRAKATICTRRLHIRVHHISGELEGFERPRIQRDGFVTG